ncbi:Napsin-A precursor, putative [Perkinsus marinus ATCC 50983]|uniref:Napsin-A, putative n=1 Tax=Perkinsus marinus (strain ATCC 50983 / TXsc) TaxID=423536 RepID=C5L5I8_PERM5|nr:Napsin-A precursor, putative [Perkinsus marinus ATCC 50983]EER08013.1 Napsin-A precursor, putative [Perkinsus marinus ATCC 50983]|eukprot:XP_002776197.1 Napsin-A precursor, putative [Perkinsus marinus ATCC 50983]
MDTQIRKHNWRKLADSHACRTKAKKHQHSPKLCDKSATLRSKILTGMHSPMSVRLLSLINVFDVLNVSRGETLKLDVKYQDIPKGHFGLYHTLVDENGKELHALVDTGTSFSFFIWKDWYEWASGHPCSICPMGCYACSEPCLVGKVTRTLTFEDKYMVKIFQHKSKLTMGQVSEILTFGLIFDQKPPVSKAPPTNLMGLGYDGGDVNFPSLMTQLRSSKTVTSGIIALYLYPPADPNKASADGGLLLGGGDPALYEGALRYVDFSTDKHYMVNIDKLQVGDGHITLGINMNLDLDTGANFLYVPTLYFKSLIKEIGAQADNAAGKHVPFYPVNEHRYFPCQYMSKLPPLRFYLGPQGTTPFTMTYTNYALNQHGICELLIFQNLKNDWSFPDRMLIGNYFEFDPTLKRVGIGKLKPRSL